MSGESERFVSHYDSSQFRQISENARAIAEVPRLLVEHSNLDFPQSSKIQQFKIAAIIAEAVAADLDSFEERAMLDVEGSVFVFFPSVQLLRE